MKLRKVLDKGNPNNKKVAYDFFVNEKGYSPEVALGIIGNLMQESHVNLDTTAVGFDGSGSFGIAQWLGPRKRKLKQVRPNDYNTLRGQLEFIDWELNNTEKRAASKLRNAKTIEDATLAFSKYYERPHKDHAHNNKRVNYALNLAKQLGINLEEQNQKIIKDLETQREVIVDNTRTAAPPVREIPSLATPPVVSNGLPTYTILPEPENDQEKKNTNQMTEEQVRKLLQAEKARMDGQRLSNTFSQQPQPQMQYAPQQPQQDLSYLYDYIDINNYRDGGTYTVKQGDTLSKIASANNLSLNEILELNQAYRDNPDMIGVGDKINLGRTTQSTSQPTVSADTKRNINVQDYLNTRFKDRQIQKPFFEQARDNTRVKPIPVSGRYQRFSEKSDEFSLDNLDTPEKIKRAQTILYYSGYDLGENKRRSIDGKLGPKTKKAIEDYKKAFLNTDTSYRQERGIMNDISNIVPLAARQYIYDTFGGDAELNEKHLSDEDYDALKQMVTDNLKNDKRILNYEDYKRYLKSDKNVTTRGMGLGNPFSNLEKTLGAANIEVNEVGDIFVKDQYNWNDAGGEENRYKNQYRDDDGLLKISSDNSFGTNMYRLARNFKTKYGRREGGSDVKIFVGNVSDIF